MSFIASPARPVLFSDTSASPTSLIYIAVHGCKIPARGAAAIHRGVAATEHDDAAADFGGVSEGDAGKPVDADMDIGAGFLSAGNFQLASARRAAADENGVVILGKQRLQAFDAVAEAEFWFKAENISDLFVQHGFRQTEFRDLRPHHAAGGCIDVVDHDVIAKRQKIARDGERCRTSANQRDTLAVLIRRGGAAVVPECRLCYRRQRA